MANLKVYKADLSRKRRKKRLLYINARRLKETQYVHNNDQKQRCSLLMCSVEKPLSFNQRKRMRWSVLLDCEFQQQHACQIVQDDSVWDLLFFCQRFVLAIADMVTVNIGGDYDEKDCVEMKQGTTILSVNDVM
ncbi:hypothetical protein E2542_SST21673 [Spatholobus suberectus]|nr:hypothetical protein E2542_SST21673 [Spatholobus suberectus]